LMRGFQNGTLVGRTGREKEKRAGKSLEREEKPCVKSASLMGTPI